VGVTIQINDVITSCNEYEDDKNTFFSLKIHGRLEKEHTNHYLP